METPISHIQIPAAQVKLFTTESLNVMCTFSPDSGSAAKFQPERWYHGDYMQRSRDYKGDMNAKFLSLGYYHWNVQYPFLRFFRTNLRKFEHRWWWEYTLGIIRTWWTSNESSKADWAVKELGRNSGCVGVKYAMMTGAALCLVLFESCPSCLEVQKFYLGL